ncbi:MAG: amidohydrolase family protein [Clostridiales bacterium]|nr:amidohydrolase family protein [Clostridiales bacterium]
MDRIEFLRGLEREPIVNSHSHHLRDHEQHALTLEAVINNSYVSWCGAPIPSADSGADFERWLNAVRTRGYFVWLEKALTELYGIAEPLDAKSWRAFDEAIRAAHRERDWHLRALRERCNYREIWLDAYWAPGGDNGHPELFRPAYRVNSFFYGYNPAARDHNGNNIQLLHGRRIADIGEYADFLSGLMRARQASGASTFKCALAYDRSLAFGEASRDEAQRALREGAGAADVAKFQDYVMGLVCRTAAELGMPLQIHTGLGRMTGSGAMQLQPLIERNPDTVFLLMHGGYPWVGDIAGLAHVYPNVWADLCWLPLISGTAARRLLHELIDVCNADRVIWGCDAWTSEESFGARLAFLDALSRVLAERVESGLLREGDAWRYAEGIMHRNAARLTKR